MWTGPLLPEPEPPIPSFSQEPLHSETYLFTCNTFMSLRRLKNIIFDQTLPIFNLDVFVPVNHWISVGGCCQSVFAAQQWRKCSLSQWAVSSLPESPDLSLASPLPPPSSPARVQPNKRTPPWKHALSRRCFNVTSGECWVLWLMHLWCVFYESAGVLSGVG